MFRDLGSKQNCWGLSEQGSEANNLESLGAILFSFRGRGVRPPPPW